jgi:hypothetical protein
MSERQRANHDHSALFAAKQRWVMREPEASP